jgi:hypothetical protein
MTCANCETPLVVELPPELPVSDYVKYVELYSPQNEVELSLLKSILDSEDIDYLVRNDNFGSLEVGPRIGFYNMKTIEVRDEQYETAIDLLKDYLEKTQEEVEPLRKRYSVFDKIRMIIEFFAFGWVMPGKIKRTRRK